MRPPGREPMICGLIDNRANHYATLRNPKQVSPGAYVVPVNMNVNFWQYA